MRAYIKMFGYFTAIEASGSDHLAFFLVKTSDVLARGQVSTCVHRLPNAEDASFCFCQCLLMLVYGCLCLVVANSANSGVDMGNVE